MAKTYEEINEKIAKGDVVVATAEEMAGIVREKGSKKAASAIDVVTTGTFAPMCSSGVFLNLPQPKPRIKLQKLWINGVSVFSGLAAADLYLGATELAEDDPQNKVFPGSFKYGGGHVIEELVAGRSVRLRGSAYGTDCYPLKKIERTLALKDIPGAVMVNPRNCYQNYNVAVNTGNRIIYTYMGILQPNMGNINYCSAGQLSPLLNDPFYRTIGMGTRIFLGGGAGYVLGAGTQHNPDAPRTPGGVPKRPAGTLAVTGDLKRMSAGWLKGASMTGYGVSLSVGIGIPIPVLDEEMAERTGVSDEQITACVVDYGKDYPEGSDEIICEVNYKQLKEGSVRIGGREVPSGSLSSYARAREIAGLLKDWILSGRFYLSEPTEKLPGAKNDK